MTLTDLKRLAEAATPKNHSHGFAISSPHDCSTCWATVSAAQTLSAALSPERILAMIRVVEAADRITPSNESDNQIAASNAYDAARAQLEETAK